MSSKPNGRTNNHEHGRRFGGVRSLACLAAATCAVLSVGVGGATADSWSAREQAPAGACAQPGPVQPNGKQWQQEPANTIDTAGAYTATLQTNCGPITIALDAGRAPRTVNSFAFLAGEQYFDHTRCHRVTTEGIFVLQCGDPTGTGTGTPGYQFPDENLDGAMYPAGTVAMANSGPDTNGSQFFLVYQDSPLPPAYTPFGQITDGLSVVQSIGAAGAQGGGDDGAPSTDVVLDSVVTAKN